MKNLFKTSLALALPLFVAQTAQAAGFFLYEHGAKATGRAGAVAASVNDGSAIFHNVAGIAGIEGYSAYVGANLIAPTQAYDDGAGTSLNTDQGSAVTPSLYLTGRINEMFSVGLGFNTPFGSTISWPEETVASAVVKKQALKTFFITPAVGVNFADIGLKFGAGLDLVPASVQLQREIPLGNERGFADLGGTAFGVGGRVGVQFSPAALDGLDVGVAWRSPVALNFKGDGDFDSSAAFRSSLPADGAVEVPVTLPMSLNAGLAYTFLGSLQLEAGITWTDWTSYDEVNIDVAGDAANIISPKDYQATTAIRFGAEYGFTDWGLDVRAGFAMDPTPIPAETLDVALPDIDRNVVSLGASYHLTDDMVIDLAGLYVLPGTNKTGTEPGAPLLKGTYEVSAFVASASFGWTIGKPEPVAAMMPVEAHTAEPEMAPVASEVAPVEPEVAPAEPEMPATPEAPAAPAEPEAPAAPGEPAAPAEVAPTAAG